MTVERPTIHEIDFCSQVASAVNALVAANPETFPFKEARLEGFGTGRERRKRKDLRFFDHDGKLILCGEVKLPGTPEGRSPYDAKLCEDAEAKASNGNIQFFFTWNVNTFVLWDRSLWDQPLLNRRVWQRQLSRSLSNPQDVAREENLNFLKTQFVPDLLRDLSDFLLERRRDWLPPDDLFIRSLESHLDWPVQLVSGYILEHTEKDKAFDLLAQKWMADQDWTFVRRPHEEWAKAVNNMAKTLAYVWINRLIFYKALRARFPDLPKLTIQASVKKPEEVLQRLNRFFELGVGRSGDYEPLLMPDAKDWAIALVFQPPSAIDAWRGLLRGIEPIDFKEVSSDVVGRIFQKLIGPDERHRYGQHFTGDDVVDLINGFCIHKAEDVVLDPACGSGSFLVRAYYRKRHLGPTRLHLDLIGELFGCDIAFYPAHLATLNLAAREINDEANYPRIARMNFFDFSLPKPFCQIPDSRGGQKPVFLRQLDAVVGNPPYVRQEKIEKKEKDRINKIANAAWRDLHLSGRSDLHCYFWPVASKLLKPDGYYGFLTSSSWLDVEYGFALQGWILHHFRILAIMESAAEPWFEDARVKTCVTILQRCDNQASRMANCVRFVRFNRKLLEIIGVSPGEDENKRQAAIEALRKRILEAQTDCQDQDLRIIIKTQKDLWVDGVRAEALLGETWEAEALDQDEEFGPTGQEAEANRKQISTSIFKESATYRAGKWGRYLRAPDFYFDIKRQFGNRFVALGEIASIRFGVKTGCDAFFMPRDITDEVLRKYESDRAFCEHSGGAPRKEVQSGRLKVIQAGDGSIHPIESEYLAPEVHSLMQVDRPVVRSADLERVVLLVGEPMETLKAKAPWVYRYLRYGMTSTFASSKSKPVPVPKRSTCAAREPWYDLTGLVQPGIAFWPMAQQYRHIIASNPEHLICNHNLFDVSPFGLSGDESTTLVAVLNSTLVGLFKTFYGRFAGTEGNLKTEVVDVNLLEVPDPRGVLPELAKRLRSILGRISEREVGRLVEEQLMDCHSIERARKLAAGQLMLPNELKQPDRRELDDAVFELLGVVDPQQRGALVNRLYEATTRHFREIRVVEIEKMQQRAKSNSGRFSIQDLAADVWDAVELEDATPLAEWIRQCPGLNSPVYIAEERPAIPSINPLFFPNRVYFGKARKTHMDYRSREQAKLVVRLANLGISGNVKLPEQPKECADLFKEVDKRINQAQSLFYELVTSRTSDNSTKEQLTELLLRWFVLGRETSSPFLNSQRIMT